jgi:hypothetical protein
MQPGGAVELLGEVIARGWENFTARPTGSLNLRFLIQPALAMFLGIRAGLNDARTGRRPYLWAAVTCHGRRWDLLKDALNGLRMPLLVAALLDAIYQTVTHQGIYMLELLFTVVLLALVPYSVVRGLANRFARLRLRWRRSET